MAVIGVMVRLVILQRRMTQRINVLFDSIISLGKEIADVIDANKHISDNLPMPEDFERTLKTDEAINKFLEETNDDQVFIDDFNPFTDEQYRGRADNV